MVVVDRLRAPTILTLTRAGIETGRRIKRAVPGASLLGHRGRVGAAADLDALVDDPTEALRRLFRAGQPIVAVCAAGIVIRALAPLLGDKATEPPVLAADETGASILPLLGGHRGANRLARTIADALGGHAAVTTAGDVSLGVALDDPPDGWRLSNPRHAKSFMAGLLADPRVRLVGSAPFLADARWALDPAAPRTIRIDYRRFAESADEETDGGPDHLLYRPAVLALGVGCARGCAPADLAALVEATLAEARLSRDAVAVTASIDLKEDEPAVIALAELLGVPMRVFPAARLADETPRLITPSDRVFAEVGCHGVAEAAALAAAGPAGTLIVPKRKSADATCAIALAPSPIRPAEVGRARGHLAVVGLGPGQDAWRTPEAAALIAEATDLVGYRRYLDLLGPTAAGKTRHDYGLGEETTRVRRAIALAAQGRRVALVCSGDPGIYAMASLVHEQLDGAEDAAWRRIDVTVAPGISAVQAAAARIGAPLGHDFCAISLSDLLTPWATIERRLRAAAEADFVVALYNPRSRDRHWQLGAALAILAEHRPADTPVVLATNVGRLGESLQVRRLSEVAADAVDMLTIVLVGASATRRYRLGDGRDRVYTPRGYAANAGTDRPPSEPAAGRERMAS